MAAEALGDERPTLFLRKATGLVRGWSVRDSLIYACLATNFVTLGIYEFTFAGPAFPKGQFITAVLISGDLGVVPGDRLCRAHRHDPAGGRRLRLADPDPGQRHRLRHGRHRLVVHPLAVGADLRQHPGGRSCSSRCGRRSSGPGRRRLAWFGTHNGIFIVTLITIALAGVLVSHRHGRLRQGPAAGASIGGLVGFAVVVILLLINSHAELHRRVQPGGAEAVRRATTPTRPPTRRPSRPATPRRRSASARSDRRCCSSRRSCSSCCGRTGAPRSTARSAARATSSGCSRGMFFGLWLTVAVTVIFLLLMAKTFGWGFYQNLNSLDYNATPAVRHLAVPVHVRGLAGAQHRVPGHPDPGARACGSSAGWEPCSCPRPGSSSRPRSTGCSPTGRPRSRRGARCRSTR